MRMRNAESWEPEWIGAFPEAGQAIEFAGQNQEEIYAWANAVKAAQPIAAAQLWRSTIMCGS